MNGQFLFHNNSRLFVTSPSDKVFIHAVFSTLTSPSAVHSVSNRLVSVVIIIKRIDLLFAQTVVKEKQETNTL